MHTTLCNNGVFSFSTLLQWPIEFTSYRFCIISICWDTPSENTCIWHYYQRCPVPLQLVNIHIGIYHCTCTCTQSVSNREPCRTIQIVSRKYREEIEHIIVDHNRNFKIARFLRWFEIRKVSTAWRIYNNRVLFTDSNLYNL